MSQQPSAFGFINLQPKSRAYRRSLRDKVAMERRCSSSLVASLHLFISTQADQREGRPRGEDAPEERP